MASPAPTTAWNYTRPSAERSHRYACCPYRAHLLDDYDPYIRPHGAADGIDIREANKREARESNNTCCNPHTERNRHETNALDVTDRAPPLPNAQSYAQSVFRQTYTQRTITRTRIYTTGTQCARIFDTETRRPR
jgi:hypothetical protein